MDLSHFFAYVVSSGLVIRRAVLGVEAVELRRCLFDVELEVSLVLLDWVLSLSFPPRREMVDDEARGFVGRSDIFVSECWI